jgi:hypothetical protein
VFTFLRRFVLRVLFAPVWLVGLLVLLAIVFTMMAIAFVSVGCFVYAAFFGLGYWVRHDPEMGRVAIDCLLFGIGGFSVLVAFQGIIWDGISALWNRGVPSDGGRFSRPDENFDEIPCDAK